MAEKWLKDRKGEQLSLELITHYARIIYAIQRTTGIINEVDEWVKKMYE